MNSNPKRLQTEPKLKFVITEQNHRKLKAKTSFWKLATSRVGNLMANWVGRSAETVLRMLENKLFKCGSRRVVRSHTTPYGEHWPIAQHPAGSERERPSVSFRMHRSWNASDISANRQMPQMVSCTVDRLTRCAALALPAAGISLAGGTSFATTSGQRSGSAGMLSDSASSERQYSRFNADIVSGFSASESETFWLIRHSDGSDVPKLFGKRCGKSPKRDSNWSELVCAGEVQGSLSGRRATNEELQTNCVRTVYKNCIQTVSAFEVRSWGAYWNEAANPN